jgi:NADPH-dependent 2,4-dienoyl-CoA reductase/sulfur reductase-like enzyme
MDKKPVQRKVAIIGGGPGGMQAAITASKQGHNVTLYEEKGELGGMLNLLGKEYLKREMRVYRDYLARKTNVSANVLLNTKATKRLLEKEKYDYIIAAIGSTPIIPNIPGVDKENAITAAHIRDEEIILGRRVCILGGGMAGCEAAFELAEEGYVVSLVEVLPTLFPERDRISRNYSMPILARLQAHDNVTIYRNTKCTEVLDGKIKIENDGEESLIPADSIVFAVGVRPNSEEVDELWDAAPEFRAVGDCVSPRFILDAVSEAYFAAMDVY